MSSRFKTNRSCPDSVGAPKRNLREASMAADDDRAVFRHMLSRSMFRTSFLILAAAAFIVSLVARQTSNAAEEKAQPMQIGDIDYATKSPPSKSGYLTVNDLEMYYEVHGDGGTPLVLLHGAFSAIGTSFGRLLPDLAEHRQVIAFELRDTDTRPTSTARCRWSRWRRMWRRRCPSSVSRGPTSSATAWAEASHCDLPSSTRSASASSCFCRSATTEPAPTPDSGTAWQISSRR